MANANPIIFDDGGSIRIRTEVSLDDRCIVDGLLNVDPHRKGSHGSTETVVGPYTHITGCTICRLGGTKEIVDRPLIAGDHFTIHAANHQCVIVRIDEKRDCVIKLRGADDNPPIVDLSKIDNVRQYKVVNAGPIQTIDGVANGEAFAFAAAECKSIHSSLVVRDESEKC